MAARVTQLVAGMLRPGEWLRDVRKDFLYRMMLRNPAVATILSLDAFRPRVAIRAVATLLPLGAVWSPFGASRRVLLAALQAFHARWRRRRGWPLRRRRVLLRRRGGLR